MYFNPNFYIRPSLKKILLLDTLFDCLVKALKLLHDVLEASTNRFAAYHPHYKEKLEIVEAVYNLFLWSLSKLISLFGISSHCIIEVITPLHDVLDEGKHWFAIYHPHYKDKFVGNLTQAFVCATNCLYFLNSWSNLSAAFFFAYNNGAYTAESSLVSKKRELLKIFLHLFFCLPLLSSLLFSLKLSKMRLAIFKCLIMSECATISEWQLSFLALANFSLLANSPSVKLTSEETIKKTKIIIKDYGNLILHNIY